MAAIVIIAERPATLATLDSLICIKKPPIIESICACAAASQHIANTYLVVRDY